MRRRGDNRFDDGSESGSDVRAAVIATVNAIATASAMEVAVAMATDTERWWFGTTTRDDGQQQHDN
jgi:hypothetical protein